MAQNTRKWDELLRLAQARAGIFEGASAEENSAFSYLLNSAARTAYNENPWWERWLVLEPRTVERGYVQFDEDSFNVFGAGTSELNGLYVRNGVSADGNPAYTLYDSDGTTVLYSVYSATNSEWRIIADEPDALASILYFNSSSSTTPPESSWETAFTADEPAPLVQALSEIGEYIGHWNGAVFQCSGATPGTAYPDQNGIRITNCNAGDIVYVAFKKSFTLTYGDGNQNTIEDIPTEWFEYMAYSAARAWRASQAQPDGYNPIALADVQKVFDQALLKINRQGIYLSIGNRFRTYYGCDVSVR